MQADAAGDGPAESEHETPDPVQANVSTAWTFLGDVVGTPAYLSPEQACGDTEAVDQRSDVFALGGMLCEILTGTPPYSAGDRAAQLEQAQRGDLTASLARLDSCLADRELIELARDCLAVEPADRPPDAGDVSQRLSVFLRGIPEKLRKMELERAERQARAEERRRRRRIILTLAASLTLLVVLSAAGAAWMAQREAARRRQETVQREQIQRQLAETLDEAARQYAGAPEDGREDPLRRTKIRELVRRAETLAESPWAEPVYVGRVRGLRDRIAAEDADGRLLDRLEAIRLKCAEVNPRTNRFASGRTRPMYRQVRWKVWLGSWHRPTITSGSASRGPNCS